ncbi:MAG TPA: 2-hydroxyacid dehydrogenase [Aurantimonas sp.]|jgi:phosphoglycerate dehydrogenase-like enzyme|nr:2-hydroxyacid dehydrogenase [Aurantimonas sp.]
MKIFMIGEAANHADKLAACLHEPRQIVPLPREAAYSADFDSQIGADDAVISLRLKRPDGPCPPFRLLHVPGAGLDGIDFAALSAGTTVCNVFEHEIPIAEYVLAAMLEWEIRAGEMRQSFTPQAWPDIYRQRVPHGEIHGKTLGLVGFGRIGRAIALRAKAFGMRILALDAFASDLGPADRILPPDQLDELLPDVDYLVLACPLTEATHGLIGRDQLAAMKPTAVLINISRAEIADEAALYEALSNKVIGGACLDVWYRYPTGSDDRVEPANFPFHALENAVCTPHSSAWTRQLPQRRYAFMAANLDRLARGEALQNVVRAAAEPAQ